MKHTKKVYTKRAKRLMRLKNKTRRLKMRSSRRHGRRRSSRYRRMQRRRIYVGGVAEVQAAGTVARVPVMDGASDPNIHSQMAGKNENQNAGNHALKGGKGQRGGNKYLDLYQYKPPPGMMGPIPQPSQDTASNNLILQAAKISTTGQANAQYDCKGS